jgi:hypothetical protein
MGRYQVAIISRPQDWTPECPDDVPLELNGPVAVLGEWDDIFEAVNRTIEHNENSDSKRRGRWAVVVEQGRMGRIWPAARLVTPLTYKVTAIWWPEGWEPDSPLDVPNCVWQSQGRTGGQWLTYEQAEATMRSLNQQCLDNPSTTWYVVTAVENEAVSHTVSYDPSGTETTIEVRCIHVIRPKEGGHGNCKYCPAGTFPCSKSQWSSQAQTISAKHIRAYGA